MRDGTNYDFNLRLVATERRNVYRLLSPSNHVFHEFRATSMIQAEMYAKAYTSTWNSVKIEVVDDN